MKNCTYHISDFSCRLNPEMLGLVKKPELQNEENCFVLHSKLTSFFKPVLLLRLYDDLVNRLVFSERSDSYRYLTGLAD